MPLMNDDVKPNFDTTLTANYDENGDGAGLNPQPLNVDVDGNLRVVVSNLVTASIDGAVESMIEAVSTDDEVLRVRCDNNGALNQGGVNINGTSLQAFSASGTYPTYLLATAGIQTLRNSLISDVVGHGNSLMYNYSENIAVQGTNFYVFVSCYGGR